MALNRKYAALPDLDSAPDIYETPELTDDNSTVPPTTVRSQSEDEYDDDADEDATGISRTRLRIDQARSRFLPSGVDAGSVDFSDRVDGKRKSYKTTTRRHRILEDGTEELGDLSGDDDAESLERKIARLKRELAEVKEEHSRLAAASQTTGPSAEQQERQLSSLSDALDEISRPFNVSHRATEPHVPVLAADTASSTQAQGGDGGNSVAATYTITYAPNYEQSHTLAKTADFDQRLTALEKAIGIASTAVPGVDAAGLPRAILPNLEALQRQLSTFSQAATSNFDTASRRIRNLVQEAEKLEKARVNAKAAQEALGQAAAGAKGGDDSEQVAKINALYGTLPTIESLAPLLPPLLDRLRSLRVIHGEAAAASETMSRIEQQQSEMAAEIKQWREGLDKVEAAMKAGDETMAENQKVMETWVKQLEQRIAKLG